MSSPAETYESEKVPVVFEPLALAVIEHARPQPRERVLDIACGTGIVARRLAPILGSHGTVVGLDHSPGMLAVARSAAQREGVTIDWHEGKAESLPFQNGTFDLVLCQQGLQFIPDKSAALDEMYRVLVNGGRVIVSVWKGIDFHPFQKILSDVMAEHLGIPAMHETYALGDADELRELLIGAGFRDAVIDSVSIEAFYPDPDQYLTMQVDVVAAAIPSGQHLDEGQRKELARAIRAQMKEPISKRIVGNHLVVPTHAFIAKAIR